MPDWAWWAIGLVLFGGWSLLIGLMTYVAAAFVKSFHNIWG